MSAWTQYLAFQNKFIEHLLGATNRGFSPNPQATVRNTGQGNQPAWFVGVLSLCHFHFKCICKHNALSKGTLYPESFPIFFFFFKIRKSTFIPVFAGSRSFIIFSPGTLPCLNMKVYKSILRYGILRMFQSKVKLVLKTLLAEAKLTVWLNSLKGSWLQLLRTS